MFKFSVVFQFLSNRGLESRMSIHKRSCAIRGFGGGIPVSRTQIRGSFKALDYVAILDNIIQV